MKLRDLEENLPQVALDLRSVLLDGGGVVDDLLSVILNFTKQQAFVIVSLHATQTARQQE